MENAARKDRRYKILQHPLRGRILHERSLDETPQMKTISAVIGSAIFFVVAPGTVVGFIPWWITRWRVESPQIAHLPLQVVGGVLVAAGLVVVVDSFARFALRGLGTPAPIFPTRHLVVSGLYRYVRNPIYVSLLCVIVGQGLLFGNALLFGYAAVAWLFTHVFVLAYEEPTLRASFGAEYETFCAGVPRWIPRLTAWRG